MLSTFFGSVCTLAIAIDHQPGRRTVYPNKQRTGDKIYVFSDGDDIAGTGVVSLKSGKKLEHGGIRVELVGQIVLGDKGGPPYDFFVIAKDLEPPGTIYESKSYRWKFSSVDLSHDSYVGSHVHLRYFVRLSLGRSYTKPLYKEVEFAVQNYGRELVDSSSIKMEVGIEDCLHIEFEYDHSNYHLKGVVIGKVYFLLVRIKIKHMELDIVRAETVGTGSTQQTETETVTKFEIMDGAAVKSECIPVRLYLSGYDLTPTYRNVQNKFSVKYYLNLVLVDEEERRYFKKQEITLFRKSPHDTAV